MRSWLRRPAVLVAAAVAVSGVAVGLYLVVAGGGARDPCDLHVTTATFPTRLAAAPPGQTICLAAGDYGDVPSKVSRSPGVTIRGPDGGEAKLAIDWNDGNLPRAWLTFDGVTITSLSLSGPTHDVTWRNSLFSGYTQINAGTRPATGGYFNNACGNCPALSHSDLVFDHDTFNLRDCPDGSCTSYQTRFAILGDTRHPAGITIRNSLFTRGCRDGIQFSVDGGHGVTVGPGNEFVNLVQTGCEPAHVDSIQFVGGASEGGTVITGNFFHDDADGIMSFDGGTNGITVTDNVLANLEAGNAINLGGDSGSVVEHNTLAGPSLYINFGSKAGQQSVDETVRNNITPGGVRSEGTGGAATYALDDWNMCASGCTGAHSLDGRPAFTGGARPATYEGFHLADGSAGQGAASDGGDMGIR